MTSEEGALTSPEFVFAVGECAKSVESLKLNWDKCCGSPEGLIAESFIVTLKMSRRIQIRSLTWIIVYPPISGWYYSTITKHFMSFLTNQVFFINYFNLSQLNTLFHTNVQQTNKMFHLLVNF